MNTLKINASMETFITEISLHANQFDDDESKSTKSISDFFVPCNNPHAEGSVVSPAKIFPPSQRASMVPKTDRNLKHFFDSETSRSTVLPPSSSLTIFSKEERPPTKKLKVCDLLVSDVKSSSWSCKQCTFENHALLDSCEMCDGLKT